MKKTFECPMCHKELEAETKWGGQETECPYCFNTIKIPLFFEKIELKKESSSCKSETAPRRSFSFFKLGHALLLIAQTAILAAILFIMFDNRKLQPAAVNNISGKRAGVDEKTAKKEIFAEKPTDVDEKTAKKEEVKQETGPYAELKKQYNLDDRHIEFMKNQMPAVVLQDTIPQESVRLMVLVSLGNFYNWGYTHCQRSHYSIRVRYPTEERSNFNGYIERDSEGGRKLFEKLKDGKLHFAEIEICYGPRSYQTRLGWQTEFFDITKVIDVR